MRNRKQNVQRQKRLRHLASENGQPAWLEFPLEFEGERAFVVWDEVIFGAHALKARIEIDPELLERNGGPGRYYSYHGPLILPRPQDN